MEKTTEKIPTWSLCYIVNGDASGLTEEEIQTIDRWYKGIGVQVVSPVMDDECGTQPYFSHFRGGEDIAIDALDAELMNQYEAWLKEQGVKRNSSSCYLRTLRTLYRKAVEKELTTDKDIFRHVFTGFASTVKRALPIDTIRAIRRLYLQDGSDLAFARDMFMLCIYLQGISFVDMAYLKKDDIRNGLLQYSRKKTGQSISIGWEPVMQEIVDTYAHLTKGSPYLLPIITKQDGTAAVRTNGT